MGNRSDNDQRPPQGDAKDDKDTNGRGSTEAAAAAPRQAAEEVGTPDNGPVKPLKDSSKKDSGEHS